MGIVCADTNPKIRCTQIDIVRFPFAWSYRRPVVSMCRRQCCNGTVLRPDRISGKCPAPTSVRFQYVRSTFWTPLGATVCGNRFGHSGFAPAPRQKSMRLPHAASSPRMHQGGIWPRVQQKFALQTCRWESLQGSGTFRGASNATGGIRNANVSTGSDHAHFLTGHETTDKHVYNRSPYPPPCLSGPLAKGDQIHLGRDRLEMNHMYNRTGHLNRACCRARWLLPTSTEHLGRHKGLEAPQDRIRSRNAQFLAGSGTSYLQCVQLTSEFRSLGGVRGRWVFVVNSVVPEPCFGSGRPSGFWTVRRGR